VAEPGAPDSETREHLLDVLAELVARGGAAPLLLPPVAPGDAAFPDRWAPTRPGVALLLRRLAWHAGLEREIEIEDRRAGAKQTERKPATSVELIEVREKLALFVLHYIGEDDVVGTLAHEIGVAYAALHRPDEADPFRKPVAPIISIDPDLDLERGSIAAVYLGLGVLAANAARQQHSVLERQSFNPLFVASVGVKLEAGHLQPEALAFLVAVQAVVRGEAEPPPGLVTAQRHDVAVWIDALRGRARELRARLGIADDARGGARPKPEPFEVGSLEDEEPARPNAFRWQTHRGGVGLIAGTLLGAGMSVALASRTVAPIALFGGALVGHVAGRRVRVPRCSACATICTTDAVVCKKCGAALRGDITSLSERLDAEEKLGSDGSK